MRANFEVFGYYLFPEVIETWEDFNRVGEKWWWILKESDSCKEVIRMQVLDSGFAALILGFPSSVPKT